MNPSPIPQREAHVRRRVRIAVVAPVLPFRSGIAQHSTRLVHALRSQADVSVTSFSRQYPDFLFPGESDRDPAASPEPGVVYDIDSINPLTWFLAARRIVSSLPDALLIPWWTFLWMPCFWVLARHAAAQNIPTIFLCHNIVDHEAAWWKRLAARAMLSRGSAFLVHSEEAATQLQDWFQERPTSFHPHPLYDHFPAPQSVSPPRAELELLFFGLVRPYKGLDILIEALSQLDDTSVQLTIAGEFWSNQQEIETQIARSGLTDRVEVIPRYVSDQEAANLFARADIVVLPYRSATGSGVIANAYHYGKPVLVTDVGGLPDVVREGKTGWVVPSGDPRALSERIRTLSRTTTQSMQGSIKAQTSRMSWESLAESILDLVPTSVPAKP